MRWIVQTLSSLGVIGWMVVANALLLFGCSSVRHALFQSNALDLGWFDQAVYLISQGQPPIVSFGGFHVLGDHAAWILYPLAWLYKLVPSVHWLLGIQAIALSLGVVPLWYLALQAGITPATTTALSLAYLLHPLIFNVNLFDFHPDVIALPALLGAVWAARSGRTLWFLGLLILILSCKAVLALTVFGLGVWLVLFDQRRLEPPLRQRCQLLGFIALISGIGYFILATQVIIPSFRADSGPQVSAIAHFRYLGNSVGEIARNLLIQPGLWLRQLFSWNNVEYMALLVLSVIWGLSPRHLTPLIAALPALGLNLLSTAPALKNLTQQYSLPILPFLLLAIISALGAGDIWVRSRRGIILCATVGFLLLAKYGYFGSLYLQERDTWQASQTALSRITGTGAVLATSQYVPHVTHRPEVQLAIAGNESIDLQPFQYVWLNTKYPGWASDRATLTRLISRLRQRPDFRLDYQANGVYLFVRNSSTR